MFGNGKIFISHTHQDNALCDVLTAALDVWQADYWIDLQQLSAGQELYTHIQAPLSERDVFIRVCTPAAQQSPWMDQEASLAKMLRAPNRSGKRLIINLVMASGYRLTESEKRAIVIDATAPTDDFWIQPLRKTLGISEPGHNLNRRAFIGVGATFVAALAALGFAGKLLLAPPAIPGYRPLAYAPTTTPQPSGSRLLWAYSLEAGLASPAVGLSVDETGVYGAVQGMLFSLSLTSGALRWQQFSGPATGFSYVPSQTAPTLVGDTLYLLANNQYQVANSSSDDPLVLLAMNTDDGTERWQTVLDPNPGDNETFNTAPVVTTGNEVFAQYTGIHITNSEVKNATAAVDATTHALLWTSNEPTTAAEVDLLGTTPDSDVWAATAVASGVIYAGLSNGNLYAYSLATGEVLWKFTEFSTGEAIQSTPSVVNGVVYFGRNDGYCYAVEAQGGKLLWRQEVITASADGTTVGVSAPTVADGVVYLCAGAPSVAGPAPQADTVCALDAASGKLLWQTHPSLGVFSGQGQAYGIMSQPLFVNGTVYVTASLAPVSWTRRDLLYALDGTDGSLRWQYVVGGQGISTNSNGFPSPPVAHNNVVYFASSDATVYALSLE